MTFEELEIKRKEINKIRNSELCQLDLEYALSNNTVSLGDFVTDHIGTIKVTKILLDRTRMPKCAYEGRVYTKAGKPTKKEIFRSAYQCNLLS